jgi:RNA polymerase sigma-70 factor, ECF subfamily
VHTTSPSLLQRLRQPTAGAWERFAQLYTPLLYYWARRLGLKETDASDLVQEVFVLLLQKMPQFEHDGRSFRSWLRTVMLHRFYDLRKKRTPQLAGDKGDLPEPAVPDETELFAEDEYRLQLAARALELMQAEFSPSTWKACWEHVVEGRSAPEVAAELGMTAGAVYAARFRVIGRLRKELEGLLD